ncbi:MAG: flagellar motor protein MotB [Clostridium sp.]|nr:flagellar motor protein MotB [Clostridium sp.]
MARKKVEEEVKGGEGWLATFSDLMNLLLCFYIMLFAMSTVDAEKIQAVSLALQATISIFDAGATAIGDGFLIGNGVSQLSELSEYINSTGKAAEEQDSQNMEDGQGQGSREELQEALEELQKRSLQENEETAEKVEEALAESVMGDQVEVTVTAQYVQLSLRGALLFDSGSAQIRKDALPVLDKVGVLLEKYAKGTVEVEGHTDNVPMSGGRYANNNELSSARALSIFDYLAAHTSLQPANIKHSGRGEYIPIADNATEAGRARNRRVEIRIYHSSAG